MTSRNSDNTQDFDESLHPLGGIKGGKMNHNASPEIFRRAKELRKQMTASEHVLWERLRANRLSGLHFRRQHPISKYIVDFYCHQYQLVIELDGEVHEEKNQKERDIGREEDLKDLGLYIIRFSNESILYETNKVLFEILDKISEIKKIQ